MTGTLPTAAAAPTVPALRKGYADSPFGQLHYAECGTGRPVLLFHQTPRSWTEYLRVLPRVGAEFRAIAMDTLGFGASAQPAGPHSIERYADAAEALMQALELDRYHLVGHHTGGLIALELAARHPARAASLLLSATPYVDEEKRRAGGHAVDHVVPHPDGSHLLGLWNHRRDFYRPGEEAALNRYVIDALTVLGHVTEGHAAVRRYAMEERLPLVTTRTLAVCAPDDRFALPSLAKLAEALTCETRLLSGGHAPVPEQLPEEFARTVVEWAAHGGETSTTERAQPEGSPMNPATSSRTYASSVPGIEKTTRK